MALLQIASLSAGAGGSILASKNAKKIAAKQAALAQAEAARLRDRAAGAMAAMQRELETFRTLRSMDLPALQQAQQQAFRNAGAAAERVARVRTMGRTGDEVREALFGGEFNQYVGRRLESLQMTAQLTQRIFEGTKEIQQTALQYEEKAGQLGLGGELAALQTEADAGDPTANILGVTAQALAAFGDAGDKKKKAASADKAADNDFFSEMLSDPSMNIEEARKRYFERMRLKDPTVTEYDDLFASTAVSK